jgi:hypothetical protein
MERRSRPTRHGDAGGEEDMGAASMSGHGRVRDRTDSVESVSSSELRHGIGSRIGEDEAPLLLVTSSTAPPSARAAGYAQRLSVDGPTVVAVDGDGVPVEVGREWIVYCVLH